MSLQLNMLFYENTSSSVHTPEIDSALTLVILQQKIKLIFFTDIAKNSLTLVPTTTISLVSSSLKRLNLADNYFNFLGSTGPNDGNKTFPKLGKLEELILDNCAIRSRHEQKSDCYC